MARYKPQDHNSLLLPVVLSEQIVPGSFAFALNYLVDHELDLAPLDIQFKNDEVGASAYDPRVMLKIVLLAYSQGLISSRMIEQACARNVQFIAISGDSQPSHTHIAKFVANLGTQIKPLFAQVLMTCDAQGLIGRDIFAIDGVKLPSNASKERNGTHAELRHRADRLDKAADKILALHQAQDKSGATEALEPKRQTQMEALRKEAARTREFLANSPPRQSRKGQELKTDVIGSGSEQAMLLPMIEQASAFRTPQTLITADAGYHSDANVRHLKDHNIPALIADNQMRSRDERFENQEKYKAHPDPLSEKSATGQPKEVKRFQPKDFAFNDDNTATCPAGKLMTSPSTIHITARRLHYQSYTAKALDCNACELSKQCLRGPIKPNDGRGRQVTRFEPKVKDMTHPSERMRVAIDSPRGKQLYSQRIGTVEPVFANIRHNKRLTRFNHRGREKVNTQWNLYCMVHNIEKLAKTGYAQ
jgi:transposase